MSLGAAQVAVLQTGVSVLQLGLDVAVGFRPEYIVAVDKDPDQRFRVVSKPYGAGESPAVLPIDHQFDR